ncbi:DNA glycosylase AlkZ-like family protein [Allonocardiopsis opalescens]|uniref:Winged helix DNA-binding protein n=1 Tax=Allonocardiopsis opalescens TaxID=1144618 RepID=A0A2T0PZ97_9ACTN|nr:crosslink repair DNA glycosylase YcaQ family protein [Allonocardiopsis opalescens]PRX96840.1 winged helix DNA-binding protein [Allonocardiopsis opalescens]
MAIEVDRARVLAYRTWAHGLDRTVSDPAVLEVLDLGIAETRGSARLALDARLAEPAGAVGDGLVHTWSFRGAPHLHRGADLPALAAALWPRDDVDAMARLGAERTPLKKAGIGGLAAFTAATAALNRAVTEPFAADAATRKAPGAGGADASGGGAAPVGVAALDKALTKGEASGRVTELLPDAYARDCSTCRARHVYGGIFQQVGLFAGVRLLTDSAPLRLAPLADDWRPPGASTGAEPLIRAYLRLHGPATLAEAADYLGTTQKALRPEWPGTGLVEVSVDGRTAWLPEDRVGALRTAGVDRGGPLVRLLPTWDPYLQARDRELLVPDAALRKEVWRVLGNPAVVMADGEIVGTWKPSGSGTRLTVTVRPFGRLTEPVAAAIETEAARVATVRGARDVRVTGARD